MRQERKLGVESICGGGKAKLLESLKVRDKVRAGRSDIVDREEEKIRVIRQQG